MTIIEYHRYTVNPDKSLTDIVDHTEVRKDSETSLTRIESASKSWLKDHFGHIDIYDEDGTHLYDVLDNKDLLLTYLSK